MLNTFEKKLINKCYIGFNNCNIIYDNDIVKLVTKEGMEIPFYKGYNSKIKNIEDFCKITTSIFLEVFDFLFLNHMDIKDITLKLSNGYNYGKSIQAMKMVLGTDYSKYLKIYKNINKFTDVKLVGNIIHSENKQYIWKLKLEYKGKQYTFKLSNNKDFIDVKSCLYSLFVDRQIFLSCSDFEDFYSKSFNDNKTDDEILKKYYAYEKTSNALKRVFGKDLEWFESFFNVN